MTKVLEVLRPGDRDDDRHIKRWRALAQERGEWCPLANETRIRIMRARVARGLTPGGEEPAPARSCVDVLRSCGQVDPHLVDQAVFLDQREERERGFARARGVEPDELEDEGPPVMRVLEGGAAGAA